MTDKSDDIPQIIIACDHAGFEQKENIAEYLETNYPHYEIIDLNKNFVEGDDYPNAVFKVKEKYEEIKSKTNIKIIAVCGTGNGVCIGLNRYPEFRAINGYSLKHIILGRQHNDANCLCLGGPLVIEKKAIELVKLFLTTKFSQAPRHTKRINMLTDKSNFLDETD